MSIKPYSAIVLAFSGLLLVGIGLYFVFFRPPLLPDDLRDMGTTLKNIKEYTPGLFNWLQKVFWVMEGYIFTTGLLTVFISLTSFRTRLRGAFSVIILAGGQFNSFYDHRKLYDRVGFRVAFTNFYIIVGNCVNFISASQIKIQI